MTAEIRLFPCLTDNFGYLIHDPATKATASIDAPEAGPIVAALEPAALEPAALEPAAPPGGFAAAPQPSRRGTTQSARDPICRPKDTMARAGEHIE